MAVELKLARQAAFDRIVTVLQSQFAVQLLDIADPGLYLPAPEQDAFFIVRNEAEILTYLDNCAVGVYVWQVGDRVTQSQSTGGLSSRLMQTTITIGVALTFLKTLQNQEIVRNGKVLGPEEVYMLMSERYSGALINTLYKHARNTSNIHRADLTKDINANLYNQAGDPSGGSVRTEWTILQEVSVPKQDWQTI